MWLVEIKGVTKDEFHDVCFMSGECKRVINKEKELKAQYFLKKDLMEDIKNLKEKHPNIETKVENLGKQTAPIWFY